MGGKTTQASNNVTIPPDVLARYNSVNATAEQAAATPFQSYSSDPNAFVEPLTQTQQAAVTNTNNAAGEAQPYYGAATALTAAGAGPADPTAINGQQINQYLSPFLGDVYGATVAAENQQNQIQSSGLNGNAIQAGAFGGDRSGIAQANLAYQQGLANNQTNANLLNTGFNTALGTAQQQQGVQLSADQANLARLTNAGSQISNIGTTAQGSALSGAQAQLAAGTAEQQTQQAGLTALYNQFLQQQGYPFQTAQFLANIAEGTGALSGNTSGTTQPGAAFSDERLKDDVEDIGKTYDGQKIVRFRYKGSPRTQIGLIAQDVEKHHPKSVGLAAGYKTVDYDAATRPAAAKGHYERGGLVPMKRYASGGSPIGLDPSVYAQILAMQKDMYGQSAGSGLASQMGIGPRGVAMMPPQQRGLIQSNFHPAAQPNETSQAIGGINQVAGLGNSLKSGYKGYQDLKDWWNTPDSTDYTAANSNGIITDESDAANNIDDVLAESRGGLVPRHYASGGNAEPYDIDDPIVPDDATQSDTLQKLKDPGTSTVKVKDPMGGAASGALSGASAGSMFGPYGAAAGAVIGGIYGGVSNSNRGGRIKRYAGGLARGGYDDGGYIDADGNPIIDDGQGGYSLPDQPVGSVAIPLPPREALPVAEPVKGLALAAPRDAIAYDANGNPTVAPATSGIQPGLAPGEKSPLAPFRRMLNIRDDTGGIEPQGTPSMPTPDAIPSGHYEPDPANPDGPGTWVADAPSDALPMPPPEKPPVPTRAGLAPVQDAVISPRTEPAKTYPDAGGVAHAVIPVSASAPAPRAGLVAPATAPSAAPAKPEPPGFWSKLGDALSNEKAVIPILTGLGAMASSPSRYGWAAALQGLGAGAQAYQSTENQEQKRALDAAQTQGQLVKNDLSSMTPPIGQKAFIRTANGNIIQMPMGEYNARVAAGERLQRISEPSTGTTLPSTPGGTTTNGFTPSAPPAPAPVSPGVGYDGQSRSGAAKEQTASNAESAHQSEQYLQTVNSEAQAARANRPIMTETMQQVASNANNTGAAAAGAGFDTRATIANYLDTVARAVGLPATTADDMASSQAIMHKINTLMGSSLATGADQHALAALNTYMSATPNLTMPPKAAAELTAQIASQRQRSIDQAVHANQYYGDSTMYGGGSMINAGNDFDRVQGGQYQSEQTALKNMMLSPTGGQAITLMRSGDPRFSNPTAINNYFVKHFGVPNMARYFMPGQ